MSNAAGADGSAAEGGGYFDQYPKTSLLLGAAVLLLLGVVLSVNLVWVSGNLHLLRPVTQGNEAPTFVLPDTQGKPVRLDQLRGKAVVLAFWATWCKPCVAKMPALQAMASELGPLGVEVLGVNVEGDADLVRGFVKRTGFGKAGAGADQLRFVLDDGSVAARYGVQTLPHTVLVGPAGSVLWVKVGGGELDTLKKRARAAAPSGSKTR